MEVVLWRFILQPHCRCIRIFINMSVYFIYMFTSIFGCASHDLLLGCTPYWKYFHEVFCILFFMPLFPLSLTCSQKCINISLFELVATCIETRIFVPSFSISHEFVSIVKFSCYLLLLGQLFASNLRHSKICIQHYLYTIFQKISSF